MTPVGVAVSAAAAGGDGGGRSTASCRGKDGLVHSSNRSAHDNGPRLIRVMCGSSIPARHACVGVVDVATMGAAVIPILLMLVGCGRARRLLRAGTIAAKPGKLPVPFAPPEPPLRLLLRQLLCCCCCGGA
jgi:hypothetical protein